MTPSMIQRAFLTDGKESTTMAVMKSLGKAGIEVTVGDDYRLVPSRFSRYCSHFFTYVSPVINAESFIEKILQELQRKKHDMFFLTSDTQILLLLKYWDEISKYTQIAGPSPETLMITFNKALTFELAESLGIPIPRTRILNSFEQLSDLANALTYPVVVKQAQPFLWDGAKIKAAPKVQFAYSFQDLQSIMKQVNFDIQRVLLQELVQGPGIGIFGLFYEGKPCTFFSHKRLREANPTGGAAAEAMSIPVDPTGKEIACELMKALRWTGVAMVEFKKDIKSGELKLMEINGRFWGSLPLALQCKVNFPLLLVEALTKNRCTEKVQYPVGLRCRHINRYLTHLFHVLKGRPDGWEGEYPARWETIKDLLKFRQKKLSYYHFELSDPLPEIMDVLFWFQLNLEKIWRGIKKRATI